MARRLRSRIWSVTFADPSAPCPACGSNAWLVERESLPRRLGAWLTLGRGLPREPRTCGSCGYQAGEAAIAVYGASTFRGRASVLFRPGQAVGAIQSHRWATPNPLVYLVGATAGTVIALVLTLILGLSWWVVAVGAAAGLAIVWLIFLSTAFVGPRHAPPGHGVRDDVFRALAPKRAKARDERLEEELWRRPSFAALGLPASYHGPRWAAGYGSSGSTITSLVVGFGDPGPDGTGPHLRVDTSVGNDRARALGHLARDLWWSQHPPPRSSGPDEAVAWHIGAEREFAARPAPSWVHVVFPVEGRPVRFDLLTEGSSWVARADSAHRTVTLHGRSWPIEGLELVAIVDIEPYLEGRRRMREDHRRGHDHRRA